MIKHASQYVCNLARDSHETLRFCRTEVNEQKSPELTVRGMTRSTGDNTTRDDGDQESFATEMQPRLQTLVHFE